MSSYGQVTEYLPLKKKDLDKFISAQKDHKNKHVDKALKVYCKLLDKYEGHPELELWTGLAYKDKNRTEEALSHLIKATQEGNNKNALLYSTIGEIFKNEKKYKKAGEYFHTYLNLTDSTKKGYSKVKRLYDESIFADLMINNPQPFDPKPFGDNVNSLTSEYLPQFTADQTKLYFTRRIRNQEDIFYVEKEGDQFGKAQPFGLVNSEEYDEGAHSISADGNIFIFTHHDDEYGMGGHDLYLTKKINGEWSRPSNMGRKINSIFWDSQPSLSGDGKVLFFSSTREGGFGGKDIWYSVLTKEGEWTTPRNAGNLINTSQDESSPFLHADMRTLYFRSNGHIGMGSFDLFLARREKGGDWSEVKNLGYPINTDGQEGALSVSLDGTKGYFATDNNGQEIQDHLDIYEFTLPENIRPEPCTFIKIRSIDTESKYPIKSELDIIDISTNAIITSKRTDLNGEILVSIPLRKKILIHVTAEGYMFHSDNIILDSISHGMDPFNKTVKLKKIKELASSDVLENESFVLKNIFFESGTANLQEVSMYEIERLAKILKENDNLDLKITGHTDDIGSEQDNQTLSLDRAYAVKEAIVKMGINSERLSTIGKGEIEPIASNETEEGRLQNRRTEFLLYQK